MYHIQDVYHYSGSGDRYFGCCMFRLPATHTRRRMCYCDMTSALNAQIWVVCVSSTAPAYRVRSSIRANACFPWGLDVVYR